MPEKDEKKKEDGVVEKREPLRVIGDPQQVMMMANVNTVNLIMVVELLKELGITQEQLEKANIDAVEKWNKQIKEASEKLIIAPAGAGPKAPGGPLQ